MGTRGYFVYRFRGRYYALYLPYDTYPKGLGKELVESIPEDPEGYRRWLEAKRVLLAKWDQVLEEQVLCISSSRLAKDGPDFVARDNRWSAPEPLLQKLLDERLNEALPKPCYRMPQLDLYIEYTYIIDLDREILTINNGAHFALNKIPRDSWMQSLAFDKESVALILPDLVPEGSIADIPSLRFKSSKPEAMAMAVQNHQITTARPKAFLNFPMVLRHGPLLLAHLWRFTKASLEDSMSWVLRGFTPDDFAFREIAYSILSLTAGLTGGLILANEQRRLRPSTGDDWRGFITGEGPDGRPIVLSDVGIGYHAEGTDPGSSPQESSYWFHGALIRLEADLTDPDRAKEAIAQAISFGRSAHSAAEIFDVVLLSIENVILLHVAGDKIQRTDTLPLLDIPVHYTDSLERYAKDFQDPDLGWRDYNYEKYHKDENQEKKEAEEGGSYVITLGGEPPGEDDLDTAGELKEQWPQRYRGFFAMVHLFEAVTRRAMPPDQPKEGIFPTEIYEMIISHVDDTTYRACSVVSPKFRHYCQRNLRLVEGTRICGLAPPIVTTAQPATGQVQADDTVDFKQYIVDSNETLSVDWDAVRFILDDEDGEWYGAYFIKALHKWQKALPKTTEWLVICGESERLSFISSVVFPGYWPLDLWEEEEAVEATRADWDAPGPYALPLQVGDSTHFWSSRRVVSELSEMREITMRTLPELWCHILRIYTPDGPSFGPTDQFEFPAHTKVTILDSGFMCDRICVGYIRFKRADAIVGPSQVWELARSEAEEDIREIQAKQAKQAKQQIFVIVAVGLSAEIYRWDVDGQKLLPAAAKRLDIFAEGDREELEAFLLELAKVLGELTAEGRRLWAEKYKKERELEEANKTKASGDEEPMVKE
ncbi:hypothetical protein MMC30_001946 [Trapelia coarctata]|nr:hypothetical protein [Trapelia coarctata]